MGNCEGSEQLASRDTQEMAIEPSERVVSGINLSPAPAAPAHRAAEIVQMVQDLNPPSVAHATSTPPQGSGIAASGPRSESSRSAITNTISSQSSSLESGSIAIRTSNEVFVILSLREELLFMIN